ncbi:MAG: ATPase domain-containing protein [Nanoarchaeota archaeon]
MIKKAYREQMNSLNEYVALALVSSKNYQETNLELIKILVNEQKTPGVYITLNKPYKTLKKIFEQKAINNSLIIFIDAITQEENLKKTKECLFIGSPEKLSDISIAMDQAVRAIPSEQKFVFFDSLSTLLIYHQPGTIAKFIHFLSTKMREWSVKGIIISLESDANKELINQLTQFCDLTLELK